jgi:hypothetical protein
MQADPNLVIRDLSEGRFRGPTCFVPVGLPAGTGLHLVPYGTRTESTITDAAGMHHVVAADLVALCGGDVTCCGGWPVLFTNHLSVAQLGEDEESLAYKEACRIMISFRQLAEEHRFAMYECKIGPYIAPGNSDVQLPLIWFTAAFGLFNAWNVITGERVRAGQVIIALRENGFRSHGGSNVCEAFRAHFGDNWYHLPSEQAREAARLAAAPSVIYDPFLVDLNGWRKECDPIIHASLIVHLTGGLFREKFFNKFLKRHGFSAVLYDLFDPPDIMRRCGEWLGFNSEDFYANFDGGQECSWSSTGTRQTLLSPMRRCGASRRSGSVKFCRRTALRAWSSTRSTGRAAKSSSSEDVSRQWEGSN